MLLFPLLLRSAVTFIAYRVDKGAYLLLDLALLVYVVDLAMGAVADRQVIRVAPCKLGHFSFSLLLS